MASIIRRTLALLLVVPLFIVSIPFAPIINVPIAQAASNQCGGQTQLNFVNNSGKSDNSSDGIFGNVTLQAGAVTPVDVVNQATSPNLSEFPKDPSDPNGNTYYICLDASASGRLWISIGAPIVGLPDVQPTVNETYRFGIIEFTNNGQGDISYVDNFDFPINLKVYESPGSSTLIGEALTTGNTCEIYNAFRTAVNDANTNNNANITWGNISVSNGDGFVRVISPSHVVEEWPDLTGYINYVAANAPSGEIIVEDYYVGENAEDPDIGWFRYVGTFDGSGNLTLNGKMRGTSIVAGVVTGPDVIDGEEMTVDGGLNFRTGIYMQAIGANYEVNGSVDSGNNIYARIYNDLTSPFNYGYWGSGYGTGYDTKDFFGTFPASGTTAPSGGKNAFKPDRTIDYPPTSSPSGGISYNLYAAVLSNYTSSYAFPFNENFGSGGKGTNPLVNISTGNLMQAELPYDGWDNGVVGSSTCTDGPAPTPTPGGGGSSNSSSGGSSSSSSICSASSPTNSPNLFQVNVNNTQATLYFAPAANANNYFVAYGNGQSTNQYGVGFSYGNSSGVIPYTINALSPNTTYSFIVRGGNGCASGGWSNTIQITTTNSQQVNKIYYKDFTPRIYSSIPQQPSILGATSKNNTLGVNSAISITPTQITKTTQTPSVTQKPAKVSVEKGKKSCFLFFCW